MKTSYRRARSPRPTTPEALEALRSVAVASGRARQRPDDVSAAPAAVDGIDVVAGVWIDRHRGFLHVLVDGSWFLVWGPPEEWQVPVVDPALQS
jgi:hypothetical protein